MTDAIAHKAPMTDLKLLALDSEDLEIVSAHLQDAVVRVGDMGYSKSDKRFVLLMNRYAWEAGDARGRGQRKRAGLHFDHVTVAHAEGFDLKSKEGVLELLAVTFEPKDAPSGEVLLTFAGGGRVRLEVECLEARLRDLGGVWAAKAQPKHDVD
ncbi:DUF2948 family protein [Pelagibacterium sp. 26DY04]|uniref:DUF2948 family protein n=1 Tax=Pelagibacterium sp. 26DY04 TaxID=2967130 RepID=UPI002816245A|nr:DUF2948 family protein [Pelagibacterium sp. 26DY04]WMT87754.1 DUF2948 family protein [Pelagibacterium sp. 26DY04]